ncbi:hypothetical protein EDD21DRAFT_414030 [Dissophora ornata]|nr:hypothetical protein EDD21DRAFT_414030 [Dissophora ornata]
MEDMDKAAFINAMKCEHPTRTLNVGIINANRAIGQCIERLSIQGVDETDQLLVDKLCPRVKDKTVADDNNGEADQERDEHDGSIVPKNEPLLFLSSLLLAIYASDLPTNKGMGLHVRRFIEKAKDFLTKQDVAYLWNYNPSQIKIVYLDLGQAFAIGASAILPSPEHPTIKQKVVYQPTFKHGHWMEQRKGVPIDGLSYISRIETDLPHRHGTQASINDYRNHLQDVEVHLESFYGNVVVKKWNAGKARDEEYKLIADRLLRLGGSTCVKREDSNKVVIGVGLGKSSAKSRLSSLHESFQSHFTQKARSLNYIAVSVNEYYTSKKCPTCEEFVG